MSAAEIRETLLDVYTCLYTSILDKSVRKINLGQNGQSAILTNFCTKLEKKYGASIGPDWLVDYCIYQVHYWHDKTTQQKVTLGWVMGDKALARYEKRPEGKTYYEDIMLQRKLKVSREELKQRWRKPADRHPLAAFVNPANEEPAKWRHHNTLLGFYQCQSLTTLYADCPPCQSCTYMEKCKNSLKINYPSLAYLRGIR